MGRGDILSSILRNPAQREADPADGIREDGPAGNFLALAIRLRKYSFLTGAQRDAIHVLWDELSDFPVAGTDDALVHLMKTISAMIRAGNAY